ncbi:MAG: acyl carrier protein [Oscillospiraceae bacterium]|nr:acyl carrier protein [Oscillospiraceae bacterium]
MLEKVINALANQLEVSPDRITAETNIFEDLGADSLDVAELIMEMEEELGIIITDETIHSFVTVGDVASFLEEMTA